MDESRLTGEAKPILVTGAAGFIGTHLTKTLLAQGHEVFGVDNFITGEPSNIQQFLSNASYHFTEQDITAPAFLKEFVQIPFGHIYHLACPTGVPNITKFSLEMLRTCSVGTHFVMEIARAHEAKVLFTSSCEVYGDPQVSPQTDGYTGNVNPTGPRCAYEEGKRFSESTVVTYVRKFGVDAKIVRIFNTYGPHMSQRDERVLPRFLRSVQRREPLTIYGDGTQRRTFLFVEDLVRALRIVMEKGRPDDVYNIGGTEQVSIRDLARLVNTMAHHDQEITFLPHFTEDHAQRQPSVDKIRALGWKPQVPLTEGLQQMMREYGIEAGIEVAFAQQTDAVPV